jgi:predicted ester cyclase
MVVTEDKAAIEGNFIGKHIGEFAGVQPTGKDVNVPLCVTYELKNGFIQEARIYMLVDVMMKQLTT